MAAIGRESQQILRFLDVARKHVLDALDGLTDEQLRTPVLPSGWTCLGLVSHLTVDVERFWFRAVMLEDSAVWDGLGDGTVSGWDIDPDTPARTIMEAYRTEVRRANEMIAGTSLDTAPAMWPEALFGDYRLDDLRSIMLHVLNETASHTGQLDAARELLDGRQWLVL